MQRVAYVATLEDVTVFGPLIATLAHQHGHHLAQEVIVLGDGAAWIWLLAAAQFPYAVQILDFFHVSERLFLMAHARFGEGTEAAKEWVTARQTELKADQIEAVLAAIAAWKPKSAAKRDLREKQRYAQAMTTQMSFNAPAVAGWIERIRGEGISLPIHLGIPGALELGKLIAVAARIGVADSARYLMKQRSLLGHLVQRGPLGADQFLRDLAATLAASAVDVQALHVFTMNQVEQTVVWQRQMLAKLHG